MNYNRLRVCYNRDINQKHRSKQIGSDDINSRAFQNFTSGLKMFSMGIIAFLYPQLSKYKGMKQYEI